MGKDIKFDSKKIKSAFAEPGMLNGHKKTVLLMRGKSADTIRAQNSVIYMTIVALLTMRVFLILLIMGKS